MPSFMASLSKFGSMDRSRAQGADLPGNGLNTGQNEIRCIPRLSVVLLEFVQIGSQQLTHQEEVLLQRT